MSAHAFSEDDLLRTAFDRAARPMPGPERRAELTVGLAFVAAATVLIAAAPGQRAASPALTALYVLGMAAASRIRFDIGLSFTPPTQVVFVPMLFALPPALVPVLVPFALALGQLPSVMRGQLAPSRLLSTLANSWFVLGPAVVLTFAGSPRPGDAAFVLPVALAAQFTGDFLASIARERMTDGIPLKALAAESRWIYLVDAALTPVGLLVVFASLYRSWALLLVGPLMALLRVFSRERRQRLEQLIELNDAYRGTALVLGDVVETDDSYTGQHCRDVVRLALDVAQEFRLDPREQRNVEFAALLHDVGKIAVPKEIINKPGALDEREWAVIKRHTIEGQRMLNRVGGIMRQVGLIVRSSHERWDGQGYPDGLQGSEIPLAARIIAACDAFNAMTTTRSYRRALLVDDALRELTENAGTQFDPAVVEAVVRVVGG